MANLYRRFCLFVTVTTCIMIGVIFHLKQNLKVVEVHSDSPGWIVLNRSSPHNETNLSSPLSSPVIPTLTIASPVTVPLANAITKGHYVEEESNTFTSTIGDSRVWWIFPRSVDHYGIHDWSKPEGTSWKSGFCKKFLVDTFDKTSSVCTDDSNGIVCYGTQYNHHIGTCSLHSLAVKPKELKEAFAVRKLQGTKVAWLDGGHCSKKDFSGIDSYMEQPDPFRSLVKVIASQTGSSQGACEVWVKGTSFFYMGVGDHIYFKMLSWYNLHCTLLKHGNLSSFNIIRLPENKGPFWFQEFEKILFPQSVGIDEFKESIVCFEKAVFVPWTYAATPFRCKMDGSWLKSQCMSCHGNGLETDLLSYRRRVLSACSLHEEGKSISKNKITFLVIQRKQYIRRLGDTHGKFQRIWTNSKELIDALKSNFPRDNIIGMFGEDLQFCEQVQLAHDADVLIGMHGAGMVHLWWLREQTVSFELVPTSQRGNGAFSTLSTLLGKKHYQFMGVKERGSIVTVDIGKLIQDIKSKLPH